MRPSPLRHPLAVLRQIIGLTQKDFAKLVGKSTTTIQAIELGKLQLRRSGRQNQRGNRGGSKMVAGGRRLKPPVSEEPVTKERTLELEFTKKYFERWRADQIKEGYGEWGVSKTLGVPWEDEARLASVKRQLNGQETAGSLNIGSRNFWMNKRLNLAVPTKYLAKKETGGNFSETLRIYLKILTSGIRITPGALNGPFTRSLSRRSSKLLIGLWRRAGRAKKERSRPPVSRGLSASEMGLEGNRLCTASESPSSAPQKIRGYNEEAGSVYGPLAPTAFSGVVRIERLSAMRRLCSSARCP